jgi:hypothetical protein
MHGKPGFQGCLSPISRVLGFYACLHREAESADFSVTLVIVIVTPLFYNNTGHVEMAENPSNSSTKAHDFKGSSLWVAQPLRLPLIQSYLNPITDLRRHLETGSERLNA